MSTIELKEILKSKIDKINDKSILDQINSLINNKDFIKLSNEQVKSIEKSQKEYLDGNFILNNSLNEEMEKWLKE